MQSLNVPVALLNKVLNYLSTKPYIEVIEIVNELLKLQNQSGQTGQAQAVEGESVEK